LTLAGGLGVYVHWPYCERICPYCDFNVVRDRGAGGIKRALARAIIADLAAHAALTGPRVLTSLFFGGGTPSLMEPAQVAQIIGAARGLWTAAPDLEITLEANPTSAEAERFSAFAQAGVNRLSLGVQALDDDALRFLGRNHDAASAKRAASLAAQAFPRLSVDLIYALPGQSGAAWRRELTEALALGAEHVSPYQLTIEPGTAFQRATARGAWRAPAGELAAHLYEITQAVLERAGLPAYEISNHARGEAAWSRHNLTYWRGEDYVGVGPGAHGRLTLGGRRWASVARRSVAGYVEAVTDNGIGSTRERLSPRDVATERLLMGLRTGEGVACADLAAVPLDSERLSRLAAAKLVRSENGRLTVTARGRLVLDRIVADLAGGA
jgi:oxygen-independent coproporphyrinogen-3 oxidase